MSKQTISVAQVKREMSTTKRFNPPRSVRAAITRAIELVKEGWTRGAWQRTKEGGRCEYCLDGAIAKACTGEANSDKGKLLKKARKLVAREITRAGGTIGRDDSHTLYRYNDIAVRTAAEVISLLEDAREAA